MQDDNNRNEIELALSVLSELRDLSDFCQRWPQLKPLVADSRLDETDLDARTRGLIGWMTALADRACPGERF